MHTANGMKHKKLIFREECGDPRFLLFKGTLVMTIVGVCFGFIFEEVATCAYGYN